MDQPSISIDITCLSSNQLNPATATENLRLLQEHVFGTVRMPTGMNPIPVSSPQQGENPVFSRADSVNDDELFGHGLSHVEEGNTVGPDESYINDFSNDENNALPFFDQLDVSDFSTSSIVQHSTSYLSGASGVCNDDKEGPSKEEKELDKNTNDLKHSCFERRSISEVEVRRKKFSVRNDELIDEVEVIDIPDGGFPHRSNSLPDIISSSSSSRLSSSNSSVYSPDVTKCDIESKEMDTVLLRKKDVKERIEGKSSVEAKPKIVRTVSFSDNVDYNEYTESGSTENSTEGRKDSDSSEKRKRFSSSSGYQTGSDERKSQSQTSEIGISNVSTQWQSGESEENDPVFDAVKSGGAENSKLKDSDKHESVITNSGESVNTVVAAISVENSSVCSAPTVTGHSSNSSTSNIPNLTYFNSSETESGMIMPLRLEPGPAENAEKHIISPPSKSLQSSGNVPNFLDGSFLLNPSTLNKVGEIDEEQREAVKQVYCNPDGSVGEIGPLTSPHHSSFSMPPHSKLVQVLHYEELLCADISPSTLQKLYISDSSTPSPYSIDRYGLYRQNSLDGFVFTVDHLEMASRCNQTNCAEVWCLKYKEVMKALCSDMHPLFELVQNYCLSLLHHSQECSEVVCPVLFCKQAFNWSQDVRVVVMEVSYFLKQPVMSLISSSHTHFERLQSSLQDMVCPQDFTTHIPISPLGKFGSAVLCLDTVNNLTCVVKTHVQLDYQHQQCVYRQLKDLDHVNIVSQLWFLEAENSVQVCSRYMLGGNLRSYIQSEMWLPWETAVFYMRQILCAIEQLHSLGLVYLFWQSDNMLFPSCARNIIKVGNFSLACPVKGEADTACVKECLPANICPPELIPNHRKVEFASDSWGAGCLMFEMLSGKQVWSEMRHAKRETIHDKIISTRSYPPLDELKVNSKLTSLIHSCWRVADQRIKVRELQTQLAALATPGK